MSSIVGFKRILMLCCWDCAVASAVAGAAAYTVVGAVTVAVAGAIVALLIVFLTQSLACEDDNAPRRVDVSTGAWHHAFTLGQR
jgi:hypothetical protein